MTDQKVRRKRPVHVEHRPDGRWAVVREGNKKASAVHPTREQAVKHARSMASKSGSEVYVHDRQGGIREHDSYSAVAETHEEALGREVASVLLTRPDTGAVERQVAYRDDEGETFIVRVESYPPTEESRPGGRTDPVGRAPAESETYERLDPKEVRRRYPELWEKISHS
jgi:Uncharacterized protein conserved in bacteria (DUF2188)